MMLLLSISIFAAQSGDDLTPDAESLANFAFLKNAAEAAVVQHPGLRANVSYRQTASPGYMDEHDWHGELRWSNDRIWYALFKRSEPDLLWFGEARDRTRSVLARTFQDSINPPSGRIFKDMVTFSVSSAAARPVEEHDGKVTDPAFWLAGYIPRYTRSMDQSRMKLLSVRRDETNYIVKVRHQHSGVSTIWHAVTSGFHPVRHEMRDVDGKCNLNTDFRYEWAFINGGWVLRKAIFDYRESRSSKAAHGELVFSNIEVGGRFTDADLSVDTLPIPFGARGRDLRDGKGAIVVKETSGFVPLAKASAAAEAAFRAMGPQVSDSSKPDPQPLNMAADRARYYWWLAARICAAIAGTLLLVSIGIWWWKRRS
jgi:hypothetical protein